MDLEPAKSLIDGLCKNDPKSQELLYKQFYSYGMSVCLRYTSSREEAVEVLNDSFMKVFTHIQQYDKSLVFRSWFRRILINTAINHYKKDRHHVTTKELEQSIHVKGTQEDVMAKLHYQEMIAVVQTLSPVYRTVFNLYVIEGYSHEEIGEQLGISVGASKSNLSRARANLRELLTRNHEKGLAKYE
ncbi:RNA polymerase sigma factor [Echinicola vietnamensis]|uniref:RNA polymerase sigma factor, sigma-70 family n=1 Tax=Echinicola vietnamensis (strain DSM 17526 / LMG 23754 / KMM 6221) TaxID=926556 RepID=L0G2R3_ECHVK|nr:sigma-70 family RNA polymerase sigma factor [Echinicola vietnamensis]AGA79130.1 RNA polymerase sigma factor, sigma-70 family [Echinicola vietnamensis DSM 17526]